MPPRFVKTAGLALGLGALLSAHGESPGPLPDVVVITLDTTRADRLSCYGYFRETTPELDRFAAEAVLFENALTHMSTTLPAHVSLFTSTYTIHHGVRGNLSSFHTPYGGDADIPSAARIFRELGYATAGFVSAAPLKTATGISAGFDTFREPEGQECRAEETTTAAIEWLRSDPVGSIFLWVHYFDPHDTYSAPPPYRRFFSTDDALRQYLRDHEFPHWDRLDIQHASNMYDGEVRYMDSEIGRFFAALRERGRWDGAAVVVVGDHGEGLGQHGMMKHDPLYAELLRVPLLLKLPAASGIEPGRRSRLTAVIDVLPTLVDELALPVPDAVRARFDGRNLLRDPEWEYVFAERAHGREKKLGPGRQYCLAGRDWKYLHATEQPDELYDLRSDPFELVNVIDEHPEVARRLLGEILKRLEGTEEFAPTAIEDLPAEYVEQLRALGYVD